MTLSFSFSVMRGTVAGTTGELVQFGEIQDKSKRGIALLKEDCQTPGIYTLF